MIHSTANRFQEIGFISEEGTQSASTLFNLIQDPAIIYDREKEAILAANNAFFLLSNLGESDFIDQPISTIIPNLLDTDPFSGHDKKAFLIHKKQLLIPVTVRIFPLSQIQNHIIILFRPDEESLTPKGKFADNEFILNKLTDLFQIQKETKVDEILKRILLKTSEIFSDSKACLYKATGSKPPLVFHLATDESFNDEFPPFLSEGDLVYHQTLEIWTPDMPILSSFHQRAASLENRYIATAPLEINSASFGLLVISSGSHDPNSNTRPLLKMVAAYITGVMTAYQKQENQEKLTNRIRQVVKIQNEIISNLDEGVIILAPDLTVAEMNPAAESILGYANIEALRQPVNTILIGSDSLGSAIKSAQQGLPTITSGDLTLHNRSGKPFPAQVMMTPILSNRQLFSIIILIKDLSQHEQSQAINQQLEQRAILGEVTAIFAHEVRNPINAIMLSLQVIEDNLEENDPNQKWINNMRDECNKLLYLMDSVLSFAKPLEYKIEGVDLRQLITLILERWHPRLKQSNISVYFESEFDTPIIEGDLRALEQVFTNLISNSANAMAEEGGTLGVKLTETDDLHDRQFIQVTMTDTGHGIPDEIKAHMFKPFVTGSQRGTGLGLAITQRIINAHKGKVEVDSYPGGTIFRIFLLKKKGK